MADAPGVHPYQRGKVAPTKFAEDGIVDGVNSSARWGTIRSEIFLEGRIKKVQSVSQQAAPIMFIYFNCNENIQLLY